MTYKKYVCPIRLPANVNDNLDEDPTGTKSLWDRGLLSGASQKADCINVFHVGETILSLQVKRDILILFFVPNPECPITVKP